MTTHYSDLPLDAELLADNRLRVKRWVGNTGFDLFLGDTDRRVACVDFMEFADSHGGALMLFEVDGEELSPEERVLFTTPAGVAWAVVDHLEMSK